MDPITDLGSVANASHPTHHNSVHQEQIFPQMRLILHRRDSTVLPDTLKDQEEWDVKSVQATAPLPSSAQQKLDLVPAVTSSILYRLEKVQTKAYFSLVAKLRCGMHALADEICSKIQDMASNLNDRLYSEEYTIQCYMKKAGVMEVDWDGLQLIRRKINNSFRHMEKLIDATYDKMLEAEQKRVAGTKELLYIFSSESHEAAYLLPKDVQSVTDSESLNLNQISLSNLRAYLEVHHSLRRNILQQKWFHIKEWEDFLDKWKDFQEARVIEEMSQQLQSVEFNVPVPLRYTVSNLPPPPYWNVLERFQDAVRMLSQLCPGIFEPSNEFHKMWSEFISAYCSLDDEARKELRELQEACQSNIDEYILMLESKVRFRLGDMAQNDMVVTQMLSRCSDSLVVSLEERHTEIYKSAENQWNESAKALHTFVAAMETHIMSIQSLWSEFYQKRENAWSQYNRTLLQLDEALERDVTGRRKRMTDTESAINIALDDKLLQNLMRTLRGNLSAITDAYATTASKKRDALNLLQQTLHSCIAQYCEKLPQTLQEGRRGMAEIMLGLNTMSTTDSYQAPKTTYEPGTPFGQSGPWIIPESQEISDDLRTVSGNSRSAAGSQKGASQAQKRRMRAMEDAMARMADEREIIIQQAMEVLTKPQLPWHLHPVLPEGTMEDLRDRIDEQCVLHGEQIRMTLVLAEVTQEVTDIAQAEREYENRRQEMLLESSTVEDKIFAPRLLQIQKHRQWYKEYNKLVAKCVDRITKCNKEMVSYKLELMKSLRPKAKDMEDEAMKTERALELRECVQSLDSWYATETNTIENHIQGMLDYFKADVEEVSKAGKSALEIMTSSVTGYPTEEIKKFTADVNVTAQKISKAMGKLEKTLSSVGKQIVTAVNKMRDSSLNGCLQELECDLDLIERMTYLRRLANTMLKSECVRCELHRKKLHNHMDAIEKIKLSDDSNIPNAIELIEEAAELAKERNIYLTLIPHMEQVSEEAFVSSMSQIEFVDIESMLPAALTTKIDTLKKKGPASQKGGSQKSSSGGSSRGKDAPPASTKGSNTALLLGKKAQGPVMYNDYRPFLWGSSKPPTEEQPYSFLSGVKSLTFKYVDTSQIVLQEYYTSKKKRPAHRPDLIFDNYDKAIYTESMQAIDIVGKAEIEVQEYRKELAGDLSRLESLTSEVMLHAIRPLMTHHCEKLYVNHQHATSSLCQGRDVLRNVRDELAHRLKSGMAHPLRAGELESHNEDAHDKWQNSIEETEQYFENWEEDTRILGNEFLIELDNKVRELFNILDMITFPHELNGYTASVQLEAPPEEEQGGPPLFDVHLMESKEPEAKAARLSITPESIENSDSMISVKAPKRGSSISLPDNILTMGLVSSSWPQLMQYEWLGGEPIGKKLKAMKISQAHQAIIKARDEAYEIYEEKLMSVVKELHTITMMIEKEDSIWIQHWESDVAAVQDLYN